jgi:heme A synthase
VIEYSHRMTAFADIVLIGVLAVVATRRARHVPRVFRTAWLAVVLVLVQAALGGIVVKGGLAALMVTAHFGTAMVLAGVLVYATVAAYSADVRIGGSPSGFVWLARAAAGATFVLMAVGTYVRGEGAGLAFPDWPLMRGRLVPSLGTTPAALHFTHRLLAVVVGILVAALAALAASAWRRRDAMGPAAVLALVASGLFVAQVLAGAANVWSKLAEPAVVTHVALAGVVWGALVATAAAARACEAPSGAAGEIPVARLDPIAEPEPAR